MKRTAAYFDELRRQGQTNAAIELFSHEDILTVMMTRRPVAVLRLLATSKALSGLLTDVPEFFSALLDAVVIGESGDPNYAFFAWEFHARELRHVIRIVLQRNSAETLSPFNLLCQRLLNLDVRILKDDDGVARLTHQNRFMNEPFSKPMFLGNGSDITRSVDRDQPYTAICELMAMQTTVFRQWSRVIETAGEERRTKLSRIYTYFYPFSLGPFELLDTRRLRLHRILLALVHANLVAAQDNWHVGMRTPGSPLYVERSDDEHTALRGLLLAYPRGSTEEDIRKARDTIDIHIDALYNEARFDADEETRVSQLTSMLQRLAPPQGITGDPYARARKLLQKQLPAPTVFVNVESYRKALRALNHDPAVARRTLVNELRYLTKVHDAERTVRLYGDCVQCATQTQSVHAEKNIFLCVPCHLGCTSYSGLNDRWRVHEKRTHSLDWTRYAGTWYEQAHVPSWFQREGDHDTTALYTPLSDRTLSVTNTTYDAQNRPRVAQGHARVTAPWSLLVEFSGQDAHRMHKPHSRGKYERLGDGDVLMDEANYIVERVWVNEQGDYRAAVVSDGRNRSLWILTREACPSRAHLDEVFEYATRNFDSLKLVMTKHNRVASNDK